MPATTASATTASATTTVTAPCRHTVTYDQRTGVALPLTPCCGTGATGTGGGEIVCRACRSRVPSAYGMAAGQPGDLEVMMAALGCPAPQMCGGELAFRLGLDD